jgi:hypothetical protein
LDYLRLNHDEKVYILDQFLLGDQKFLIDQYSTVYNVLKTLKAIEIPEL